MEEIKAGEYIRTLEGTIAKIENIELNIGFNGKIFYKHWKEEFCGCFIAKEEIVKHSFNIIDLIEVR